MAPYNKPRVVEERSPWGDLFASLPDTVLSFMQLQNQLEQRQLDREFQLQGMALNAAAEDYRFLRGQKADWEKELVTKGYKLPEYETTVAGTEDFERTTEGYQTQSQILEGNIGKLTSSLANIASAADEAKGLSDLYGKEIKGRKDEEWRDYLLEGDITMGEGGELAGTNEMAIYLEKIRTGTPGQKEQYEKLKDANYRRSLLSSLRTMEEAKNLQLADEQLESANATQSAAKAALHASNFQLFQAYNEEFDNNVGKIYKQLSVDFTAQFRYNGNSVMDLVALGAEDPSELIDIKNDFAEQYPNIAHDANKFISGIQSAQASGVDPSKFVVDFHAKAYEDFLELDEFRKELEAKGKSMGMSYGEMYANLPDTDATKMEIDRLQSKVEGFKSLGIYASGPAALNHMYAVTKMHNEQEAMRLSADVKDHERVAGYGLQLDEIESYYPEQYEFMDPKERVALEKSLAYISASREPEIKTWDPATGPNYSDYQSSKAELDVLSNLPTEPDKDYWRGPVEVAGEALFGEKFEQAFGTPDSLRSQYVDPNAPPSLASQIGASLDQLQEGSDTGADLFGLDPAKPEAYLRRVFVNSNFLRSTGIPFSDIIAQWEAAGRPEPGQWLLKMFSDAANPSAGIEEELIR